MHAFSGRPQGIVAPFRRSVSVEDRSLTVAAQVRYAHGRRPHVRETAPLTVAAQVRCAHGQRSQVRETAP